MSNNQRRDYCRTCENLRSIVISKDQKIATLHEELITAQKALIVSQENLLRTTSQKGGNGTPVSPVGQPLGNSGWPFDLGVSPTSTQSSNLGNGTINEANGNGALNGFHDHGSGPVFRAFIGDVPRDIDRGRLIQCLEITFGPVVDIQFIPSKSCAFVHFATQSGYENAIREGFVYIKGRILCIQKIKKPLECCNCTMGTA